jgi:hypothetical protein
MSDTASWLNPPLGPGATLASDISVVDAPVESIVSLTILDPSRGMNR